MNPIKLTHKLFTLVLLVISSLGLRAQDEVKPEDVSYAKVNAISATNDTLYIQDASSFDAQAGDIILVIQMKGAYHCDLFGNPLQPPVFDNEEDETINCIDNTGIYEFIQIEEINAIGNFITLTRNLERQFTSGEAIQVVKSAFYFNDAEVNNPINVTPWDPVKGYGGIFPIIAYRKITINSDINADAAGFKGGALDNTTQNWTCVPSYDSLFYHKSQANKAALKGESYLSNMYSEYSRGRGYVANAGGGGSGKYSGGAGGANFGIGGTGGAPMPDCTGPDIRAHGGRSNYDLIYKNETNRIVFGGGGGAAPQNFPGGPLATPGANGGGMIIILCDTLEGNGGKLSAKGGSVLLTSTAGAGGGGGGGVVLIDARGMLGNLPVDVTGGNGGSVDPSSCTGSGGGGGGGVVWHSWEIIPTQISSELLGGDPGSPGSGVGCFSLTGFEGATGLELDSLRVPLNGFFFNSIRGNDQICGGMRPDTIRGTVPKGGNGDFDFAWESSIDGINWSLYPSEIKDSINFQPGILYDTTYFRRLVTFEGVTDTSVAIRIDVWPQVLNNNIYSNQTICEADIAETLTSDLPTGGDDDFFYRWEKSTDLVNWTNEAESTVNSSYVPGQLFDTTYYRRYVESVTVCQDYSDTVVINVQGALENYNITADHQSCYDFPADTLTGEDGLVGGDRVDYYFYWYKRAQGGNWEFVGNDTTVAHYHPGILYDTTDFRREVTSGMCHETSNSVTVQVLDQIQNNLISADEKICYATEAGLLTGNGPLTGGNKVEYFYNWQYSNDLQEWFNPGNNKNTDFSTGVLYDTTFYRRIASSSACFDTSNLVKITVVPEITNTLQSEDTIVCENFYPDFFNEDPAKGGNNMFDYTWQWSNDLINWGPAEGENSQTGYQSPPLTDTTYFRRKVVSDICTDFSDTITTTVLPALDNNRIEEAPLTYTCYEIPKLLAASVPSGGDGSYGYIWQQSILADTWSESEGPSTNQNYITPALQDSMFYRRIVRSGNYNQCLDTSGIVLVRINTLPTGILTNNDTTVCDGQPVPLEVAFSGEAPWTVFLSDGTSHIMDEKSGIIQKTIENTNVSVIENVTIDSLLDANSCKATNLQGSVRLISYENPDPEILSAPDFCGDTGHITAKPPKFPAVWRGNNLQFEDSLLNTSMVVSAVFDEPQQAIWYERNNICASADTAWMVFYKQPVAATNFSDTLIYNIYHLELEAPIPEYDSVVWYAVEEGVSLAGAGARFANYTFPSGENTTYHLIYRINNGKCFVTDTLTLLIDDIWEPNAFTPNGDGINDYFYIEGLDEEETRELTIINPWGNIVRQFSDYDVNRVETLWDGTDEDGRPLPEGTYYYIIEVENRDPIKGYIILRRSGQ